VLVFKKKRRKGFHKKIGHRQFFTELKITGISG
jgi:large subunit ribosomal protein L21